LDEGGEERDVKRKKKCTVDCQKRDWLCMYYIKECNFLET